MFICKEPAVCCLLCAMFVAAFVWHTGRAPGSRSAGTQPGVVRAAGDLFRLEERVRAVAIAVGPAVVAVRNPAMKQQRPGFYQNGYASGVIVTADGIVLSQWHVSHRKRFTNEVDEANRLFSSYTAGERTTVILHDGRECPAQLLGANHTRDVSLLRLLPPGPYPHVPVTSETEAHVGDWLLMIGHPLGYRRDRAAVVRLGRVLSQTDEVLTTDCTFCGGDSGAPYFNLDGQLVGIVGRGYGGSMALIPDDPLLARRADQSFLFSVTRSQFIHRVFDAMHRGKILTRSMDEGRRIHRELDAAERLRTADWSQGPATLGQYSSIVAPARPSVIQVLNDEVPVALGTVVGAEGWVVTKASELPPNPRCRLPSGRIVVGQVAGVEPAFDLALLKVPANDLHPVPWAKSFDPPVGTLLAAVGAQEQPVATGVVSVSRRNMANWRRPTYTLPLRVAANRPGIFGTTQPERPGPLGLWTVSGGYSVGDVFGLAWAAGVRPGDLLKRVDGRWIRGDQDLIEVVKGRLSGDVIIAEVQRSGNTFKLRLPLSAEPEVPGTDYNYRRDNFPTVFECAVPFFTTECGGPIVDLTGRAVGITICRVASHGGMAVPGDCVLRLVLEMQAGKLVRDWTPNQSSGK